MSKSILKFYAVSPIHAGSGDSTATVDLPIQRERHTGYPVIHGSGVKGAMREHFRIINKDKQAINFIFGSDDQDEWKEEKGKYNNGKAEKDQIDAVPGAFSVSDAKILAFPMRSNIAPFVWVTCPYALKRLATDIEFVGIENDIEDKIKNVSKDDAYVLLGAITETPIILEDAVVNKKPETLNINSIAPIFSEVEKLLLISDQMFDYCVKCTDIQTNIKIDSKTGTAEGGALRYQEFLPTDTLMYSVVYFTGNEGFKDMSEKFKADMVRDYIKDTIKDFIQIGGDQTVGKGICKIDWIEGGK